MALMDYLKGLNTRPDRCSLRAMPSAETQKSEQAAARNLKPGNLLTA